MPEESELADYQDALMELFLSGLSHDQLLKTLKTDPRFDRYRDYVNQFDPDMVAVACELMWKWARKKEEAP